MTPIFDLIELSLGIDDDLYLQVYLIVDNSDNRRGSFRIIIRSKGGKTTPKKIKSNLRKQIKMKDVAEDGEDNSDFDDDVIFNEQDPNDEDEDEDESELESVAESEAENRTARAVLPMMQEAPKSTIVRELSDPVQLSNGNNLSTTSYGLLTSYGAIPIAHGLPQHGSVHREHDRVTSGYDPVYGQTAQNGPQYQAYKAYAPPATYASQTNSSDTESAMAGHQGYQSDGQDNRARSPYTAETVSNRNHDADSFGDHPDGSRAVGHVQANESLYGHRQGNWNVQPTWPTDTSTYNYTSDTTAFGETQSYQSTARSDFIPHDSTYTRYNEGDERSYGTMRDLGSNYSAQSGTANNDHDSNSYNNHTASSYAVPRGPVAGPGYQSTPEQHPRDFQQQPIRYGDSQESQPYGYQTAPTQERGRGSYVGGYTVAAGAGGVVGGASGHALAASTNKDDDDDVEEQEHGEPEVEFENEEEPRGRGRG